MRIFPANSDVIAKKATGTCDKQNASGSF